MSTSQLDIPSDLKRTGMRFGYGLAIAINVSLLIVLQNIYDWGWLPFLTARFADVVPYISLGLLAAIMANIVYLFADTHIIKSAGQLLVNLIGVFVTYQLFLVFPFNFEGSTFNWDFVVRALLILAMVGAGIGAITEAMRLTSRVYQTEK
jgi:hypothetical protein